MTAPFAPPNASRASRLAALAIAATAIFSSGSLRAETAWPSSGFFVEAEAQRVFGDSSFEAGIAPSLSDFSLARMQVDEGDGWGGAIALGYAWQTGWTAALRYRRLDTDNGNGQYSPLVIGYAPGVPTGLPGGATGLPLPLADARTEVESNTGIIDFMIGRDISAPSGVRLHLFGGLTYAEIERDVGLVDETCGCPPLALLMANDFQGLGPKIGLRGSVPLTSGVSFVGGTSIGVLFGKSTFTSRIADPLLPASFGFKAKDDRTVAAIDGEAGLAFAIGPGALTIGYRVDAILDALDTDQRVPDFFVAVGFPRIGNSHDDFVQHGPFARFSMPLSSIND